MFESLDYLYLPAPDIDASIKFHAETHGPCIVLRDPVGQRVALYQVVRPGMDKHFLGRFDTPP